MDNWKAYRRQRYRWAKGHMQCFFKHSWSVLKSRSRIVKEKIDGFTIAKCLFYAYPGFFFDAYWFISDFLFFPARWRFMDIYSNMPV